MSGRRCIKPYTVSASSAGRGVDARKFRHETDIGNLGTNAGTAAPMAFFHFGGRKDSLFGDLRAQGEDTSHFYTDKTIYVERWPDAGSQSGAPRSGGRKRIYTTSF